MIKVLICKIFFQDFPEEGDISKNYFYQDLSHLHIFGRAQKVIFASK